MARKPLNNGGAAQGAGAPPRYFTVGEVAEALAVSTRTVRRWISSHRLIAHRPGRLTRISEVDLAAFLASNRTDS